MLMRHLRYYYSKKEKGFLTFTGKFGQKGKKAIRV